MTNSPARPRRASATRSVATPPSVLCGGRPRPCRLHAAVALGLGLALSAAPAAALPPVSAPGAVSQAAASSAGGIAPVQFSGGFLAQNSFGWSDFSRRFSFGPRDDGSDGSDDSSTTEPVNDEPVNDEPVNEDGNDAGDDPGTGGAGDELGTGGDPAEGGKTRIVLRMHAEPGSAYSRYRLLVGDDIVADDRVAAESWTNITHYVEGIDSTSGHRLGVEHYDDNSRRVLSVDSVRVNDTTKAAQEGYQTTTLFGRSFRVNSSDPGRIDRNGTLFIDFPASAFGGAANDDGTGGTDDDATSVADDPAAGDDTSSGGLAGFPAIPEPLAKLRVHQLKPDGRQTVKGGGDEDLLLVSPGRTIDGEFQVVVEGFRGVYWIGASLDVAPGGWLKTPNGRTVEGVGAVAKIRTHPDPVSRPFIVLGRMDFRTSRITFGDFLQLGGDTTAGKWSAWPDVYRCRIKAEPLYGWSGYNGGSYSKYVSHSDFTKFEMGGVRHSYAAGIDVAWGYQGEYVLPSWASDKKPYAGPDGRGSAQYWNYVARAVTNEAIGAKSDPNAFFLARGSNEVSSGDHITYRFHEGGGAGKGTYLVSKASGTPITEHIHPGGGSFAPIDKGGHVVWPKKAGHAFVEGRVKDGRAQSVPTMVRASEIGWQHRVTDRASLIDALDELCG